MDENSTDLNEENINAIENAVDIEPASDVSPRDSEPYSIPVNNINQPNVPPVEVKSENVQNDFQARQESMMNSGYKKPNKKKNKLAILVVVLILLIGGGAAAYYYFFVQNADSNNKTVQTTKDTTKKVVKTVSLLPSDVVKAVQTDLTKKYPNVVSPDTKLTGDQIAFRTSDTAPYWKISGEKFYVNYTGDGASNLGVYYVGTSEKYTSTIVESLAAQGFVLASISKDNSLASQKAYTKDDVVCTTMSGVLNSDEIKCGQISKYTKNLDSYKTAKPFADAYLASGGTIAEGSMFANIQIKNSSVIGYQTAEMGYGDSLSGMGSAALFYKKGNENWRFFSFAQSMIACTSYNTADLVNAYRGVPCRDGTKTGIEATSYVK